MKKNYFFAALLLGAFSFFAFQNVSMSDNGNIVKLNKKHFFSTGGQSGLTGAPGEANCTQCHNGTVLNGVTENSVLILNGVNPVTSYIPGTTYNVTLDLTSNPTKSGFSATALDNSNIKAGTLTGITVGGTQNFAAGGRDYVSHTGASSANGQWAFSWTAPSTNVGDVTFYFASNVSNNNNNTAGDMIYLSQLTIGSTAGVKEQDKLSGSVAYNPYSNAVVMNLNSMYADDLTVNIVDMNGKSVQFEKVGKASEGENSFTLRLNDNIKAGTYVAHIAVGNNFMTKQIQVSK